MHTGLFYVYNKPPNFHMLLLYQPAAGLQDKRVINARVGTNITSFCKEHCVSILCALNDCEWFNAGLDE